MNQITKTRARGYIHGLLSRIGRANCISLAKRTEGSHDSFTKLLNTTNINWTAILTKMIFRMFGTIQGGYLIIDETTIDKSYAKIIEGCRWIWSSKDSHHVFGYHLTLLLWSNGTMAIPLAIRIYQKAELKRDQVTTIDHAISLLQYAKDTLNIKPEWVLMDGFYSADKILKQLHEWDWKYVMRVKKNRILNGTKIKELHRNPYWEETGKLSCKLTVRIVRWGKRYFVTNDMTLSKKEILEMYGERWCIESVFRVLHSELGMDECESRSLSAQMAHFHLSFIAYGVLESEQTRTENTTHYQLIEKCRLSPFFIKTLGIEGFIGVA